MKFRLDWTLATRFRKSSQRSGFTSFISSSSILGIGLGCFVLIVLLSVMNGFEQELKSKFLSLIPHAELLTTHQSGFAEEAALYQKVQADSRVVGAYGLIKTAGMLQAGTKMKSVQITGITADYAQEKFSNNINVDALTDRNDGVILGRSILQALDIEIGDRVQLLLPVATNDLSFKPPKSTWLTVVDSISIGGEADNFVGFANKKMIADVMRLNDHVTSIEFILQDVFQSTDIIREYGYDFQQFVFLSDWKRTHGHLYKDIQLVKTVIYITLTLVIAVACFNIVSSLVMAVKEKTTEIAMLKTMGAQDSLIRRVFILQGLYNGLLGAGVGSIAGCLTAYYLVAIIQFFEQLIGSSLLSDDIYFISALPSKLIMTDVILTFVVAIVLAFLATLYPARQALKISPARALN